VSRGVLSQAVSDSISARSTIPARVNVIIVVLASSSLFASRSCQINAIMVHPSPCSLKQRCSIRISRSLGSSWLTTV
jgi:hypothetical protein